MVYDLISPVKVFIVIWIILKLLQYYFSFKVKQITKKNAKRIDNRRELLSPTYIRSEVAKLKGRAEVYFDSMKQSESFFDISSCVLWFPLHGVNRYTFKHEMGHVLSVLERRYRWIYFFDGSMLLRKIGSAIGIEYKFEKDAWKLSGYINTQGATDALKGYKYLQIFNIFDIISTVIFVIIIIGLLF